MSTQSVSYRLGVTGNEKVIESLAAIGEAGDGSAKRMSRAFDREAKQAEASIDRLNKRAQAIQAMGVTPVQSRINQSTGISAAEIGQTKSAEAAMRSFIASQDELARNRQKLMTQLDPMFAAQTRYNTTMAEAVRLDRAGALAVGDLARIHAGAKTAMGDFAQEGYKANRMVGAQRAGIQQAGFQVSDFAVQVGAGTSATRAFALQGPQFVQAIALMGQGAQTSQGKFAKFAGFLGGPWGAAITVGVSILGALLTKMEQNDSASDALSDSLDFQRMTTDQLTKALREKVAAGEKAIQNSYAQAEAARAEAEQNLKTAISVRDKTKAYIESQRVSERYNGGQGSVPGGSAAISGARRIGAESELAQQNRNIVASQELLRQAQAPIIQRRVEAGNDPIIAATLKREKAEAALTKQFNDGTISRRDYRRSLDREADSHRKTTEAIRETEKARGKALRGSEKGPDLSLNRLTGSGLADEARRYIGLDENNRSDNAALRKLFGGAGINIDPDKVAWCAAFVNAVLAGKGMGGTGSLAARSFLDYGKATDSPQKGDIAVLRRGKNPAQGHVGFVDGFDKSGNPILLSGNAGGGRAVTRQTFNKRDVLSYRRAGSPGQSLLDQEKAFVQAEKERVQQLKETNATVRAMVEAGDPFAAIANRLKDTLAEIDRVAALSPAQGGIGSEQADILRTQARTRAGAERDTAFGSAFAGVTKRGDELSDEAKNKAEYIADLKADQAFALAEMQTELSLVRATNAERERQLQTQRLIADLRERGILEGTVEYQNAIRMNDALLVTGERLREASERWEEQRRIGENIIDSILDPSAWDNWGEMGKKILADLAREMLVLAAINPLKNALFGSGLPTLGEGGIGGFLRGIVGNIGGKPPGNAIGTEYSDGGMREVGEFGKELVQLPRGAKVLNAGRTRQAERGAMQAPTPANITINAPGADAAALGRVERAVQQLNASLETRAVSAVVDANQRTYGAVFG